MQIIKGRIVFRGNNIRDAEGKQVFFQEKSNSPASMDAGRAATTYGCAPGTR